MKIKNNIKIYHIMYMDECVSDVYIGNDGMVSRIVKHIPDSPKQPFWGDLKTATKSMLTERFYTFLEDRCYEDGRSDLDNILKIAGMYSNNPYEWVQVSHGVMYEDYFWVKFDDENIAWKDVKIR